jgi:DNA polymerase II large subunit
MAIEASDEYKKYLDSLKAGLDDCYARASAARARLFDPEPYVEITPAEDVAARVESIVGPPGIGLIIRKLEEGGESRETIAYKIVKMIVRGEIAKGNREQLIEQAVRTGVAIITEGVLVAPTEGIARIIVKQNPDGSDYVAVYFAGPIRSAGGTAAALAVVLADVARREFGIGDYRPTDTELERYVEEILLYDSRCARLQYKPPENEIKYLIKNCPVCIEGDPTEEVEVAVHRDLERMETNRVRSGIALVSCEGIAQKAAKVLKYTKKIGLDWSWIETLVHVGPKEGTYELKPNPTFLEDIVAGRPIFAYPMAKGGFRLRYGRCRNTGIMAKGVHPATMVILDNFVAIGTQMKVERPGKGCVAAPCDSILGPVVKLNDGSVVEVTTVAEAQKIKGEVSEILFLGDILISYGDFLKSNHPLVPGGYCDEWWDLQAAKCGAKGKKDLQAGEAFSLARKHGIPLHPKYTYFWHDITSAQIKELVEWLATGKPAYDMLWLKSFDIESSSAKRTLELLCVPHTCEKGIVKISAEHAFALLKSLGIMIDKNISLEKFGKNFDANLSALELVCKLSGVKIMAKAPTYIGARMGRPEKAKERKMEPPVHVLFPVGLSEKNRSITKLYSKAKTSQSKEGSGIDVELARLRCASCKKIITFNGCQCGGRGYLEKHCNKCGKSAVGKVCEICGGKAQYYEHRTVDLVALFDEAKNRCGNELHMEVKGVKGMISDTKIPERLEKGILRAKHKVTMFRDGTCRFDSTDVPLTHFRPSEIGVSVERVRELGYTKDIRGIPLTDDNQVLELHAQDILLSENGIEFLTNVAGFVDDLLVLLYGQKPYYNIKGKDDLVGQLAVGLSPHTSAGVLVRIIGFTKAHVGYAHPYFHTAKRRNADGDEDSIMLLMDALLNFSKKFVPASRGGTMDSPLVLTTAIIPSEVDDEVHAMDICANYDLDFYEACAKFPAPGDVKVPIVKRLLGKPEQYEGMLFTHDTASINEGVLMTAYVMFESMPEKVDAQLALGLKIRAVDLKDSAERILLSHFLPDLYGNLRAFSRQTFRCVDCGEKFRRVPLVGKCSACGGKLLLTINKGGIEKYLNISTEICNKYGLPDYLKQRLVLLKKDIDSVFEDDKSKQVELADFM